MSRRGPGRPRADGSALTIAMIVDAAIAQLDSAGPSGFSMRSLAVELGVTPMALYHHTGSRSTLLATMADRIYAGIDDPVEGNAREAIEALLLRYCERVLTHPGMTLAIFADPALYAGPAERLTDRLESLLVGLGLGTSTARDWRDILIDFTHGFAVAIASQGLKSGPPTQQMAHYRAQLALLLKAVTAPT